MHRQSRTALSASWMLLLTLAVSAGSVRVAHAADTRQRDLENFIHFVIIGRGDLAAASANSLLDSGITPSELAELVDGSELSQRFDEALGGGRRLEGVEEIVARFGVMVQQGRFDLAVRPDRIEEAVTLLSGTVRGRMMGRDRLRMAGEYAVRPLLEVMATTEDPRLRNEAAAVLVQEIGAGGVIPMCVAMPHLEVDLQERICQVLAAIGAPGATPALPFLAELAENPESAETTRLAASSAAAAIGGGAGSAAAQFTTLALRYFRGDEALVTLPPVQSLDGVDSLSYWTSDAFSGLKPLPVPKQIWFDVMAMSMARRALSLEPDDRMALAAYVAADLRREIEASEAGVEDPIFGGGDRYSPQFFATAAGPSTCQEVLALAIDVADTPLVRAAIAVLAETAGASSLTSGGRQPLLECLTYPSRRVRLEAALVLAKAHPRSEFPGHRSVVPLLASAVRTDKAFAAVIAADAEERRQAAGMLSGIGFTVVGTGDSYAEIEPAVFGNVGVDLIVVRGSSSAIDAAVRGARGSSLSWATPVVAVATVIEADQVRDRLRDDVASMVMVGGSGMVDMPAAIGTFLRETLGSPMDEAEALTYAMDSLEALESLADAGSTVLPVADAERPLLEALRRESGSLQSMVAEVLARIDAASSQQALIEAALEASPSDQVGLLDVAASSARRFGNLAEIRQVAALQALIGTSSGAIADAAGRLYGSLDLTPEEAVRLILD
jgi:hypothetical protein